MSKTNKDKFPNLGRGGSRLQNSISSFKKKGSDDMTFNPLLDNKKPKKNPVKQTEEKEEAKKVSGTPKTVEESPKKQTHIEDIPKDEPKVETSIESKPVVTKSVPKPNKIVQELSIPDDFKPHSALFSSGQLDELRNLVNFKKWKQDPKFTIQLAIYEAIEGLFNDRIPCYDFPNDFVTYAPAFSEQQWKKLDEEFVPEIRFLQKGQYALKYAIYEAIKMYLDNNPIKL